MVWRWAHSLKWSVLLSMVRLASYALVLCLAFASSALLAETDLQHSYGLGRPVAPDEIAAWDIDVRPDGLGLPPGSGSVSQGEIIYAQQCASCHGETGTEGPYDVLVGRLADDAFPFARQPGTVKTLGNYWPYATTVFDYINRAMPFNAPGSLAPDEVYGLVAYLLYLNDILPSGTVLSAGNLPSIDMPSRHRFVPDNRRGGPEVR
jgi:cytochrome c